MVLLKDKVALITGGGSGIGRATALIFAREGAKVVIADLSPKGGEETVAMIKQAGGEAISVECDVLRPGAAEDLVNRTVKQFGRLDCAFNNAGVAGDQARAADSTEECWDFVVGIDLKSVWLCMKYEIAQMLKQGSGAIVNTASAAGLVAVEQLSAYNASKHGVVGLTKTAALEFAQKNVRVNCVCPGLINTPMVARMIDSGGMNEQDFVNAEPVARMGKPEEIGEGVVWLLSDAASFVTGHAMAIDGGWVAR
jgi:NAD(P)-dependent dehydrogenase (short-subunit alcohol dehydrogenase family)